MKTFGFKGDLYNQLGNEIQLETSSIREVWTALFALYPNFQRYFVDKTLSGTDYLFIDQDGVTFESFCMDVVLPKFHYDIVPQFQGSAGMGGMLGGFAGNALMGYGMQKLTDKLTPKEESEGEEYEIITTQSHLYNQNENKVEQGTPIPLVYGQLRVGSLIINSNISNYDYNFDTAQVDNVSQVLSLPNIDSFNFLREGHSLNANNLRGDNYDSSEIEPINSPSDEDPTKNPKYGRLSPGQAKPYSAEQGNLSYHDDFHQSRSNGGEAKVYGPGSSLSPSSNEVGQSPNNNSVKPACFPPVGNKDSNYRPQGQNEKCFILDGSPIGTAKVGPRGNYRKLESLAIYRSLDLLCEGPIAGLAMPITEPSRYIITDGVGSFSNDHGEVSLPLTTTYSNTILNTNNAKFADIQFDPAINHFNNISNKSTTLSFQEGSVFDEEGVETIVPIAGNNYPANLNNYKISANRRADSRGLYIKMPAAVASESASSGGIDFGSVSPYTFIYHYNNTTALTEYPQFSSPYFNLFVHPAWSAFFDLNVRQPLIQTFQTLEIYKNSTSVISSSFLFQNITHNINYNALTTYINEDFVSNRIFEVFIGQNPTPSLTLAMEQNPLFLHSEYLWGDDQIIGTVDSFNRETFCASRLGFNTFWHTSNNGERIEGESENSAFSESFSNNTFFKSKEAGDDLPDGVLERIMFEDLSKNDQYGVTSGLGFQDLKKQDTTITISPSSNFPEFIVNTTVIPNAKRFVQAQGFDYFAVMGGANNPGFSANLNVNDEVLIDSLRGVEPENGGSLRIPYIERTFADLLRIYADNEDKQISEADFNKKFRFYLSSFNHQTTTRRVSRSDVNSFVCRSLGGTMNGGVCTFFETVRTCQYSYIDISMKDYAGLAEVSVGKSGVVEYTSIATSPDAAGAFIPGSNAQLYSFGYKTTSNEYRDIFSDAISSGSVDLGKLLRNETFSQRVYQGLKNKLNFKIPSVRVPDSTSITSSGNSIHKPVFLQFIPGVGSRLSSDIENALNVKGSCAHYMFDAQFPDRKLSQLQTSTLTYQGGSIDVATGEILNRGFYVPDIAYRVEILVLRKQRFGGSGNSTYSTLATSIEAFATISSAGKVNRITIARVPELPVWDPVIGTYTPIMPNHIDAPLPFTTSSAQTGSFERYYQDVSFLYKIDSSNNGVGASVFFSNGKLTANKLKAELLTNSNYSEYIKAAYSLGASNTRVTRTQHAQGIIPDNLSVLDDNNSGDASFYLSEEDFVMSNGQGGAAISFNKTPASQAIIGMKCEKVDFSSSYYNRLKDGFIDQPYDEDVAYFAPSLTAGGLISRCILMKKSYVQVGDTIEIVVPVANFSVRMQVGSYNSSTGVCFFTQSINLLNRTIAELILNNTLTYANSHNRYLQAKIYRQEFPRIQKAFTGRITEVFLKSSGSGYYDTDNKIANGISAPIFLYNKYECVSVINVKSQDGANSGYIPNSVFFASFSIGGLEGKNAHPVRDLSCVIRFEVGDDGKITQAIVVDQGYTNKRKMSKILSPLDNASFQRLLKFNDSSQIGQYKIGNLPEGIRDYNITQTTHLIDPSVQNYKQDLKIKISKDSISEDGSIKHLDLIQYGFGFNSDFTMGDFVDESLSSSTSVDPVFLLSTNAEGKVTSLKIDQSGPVGSYSEADNPIAITLAPPPSQTITIPENTPTDDAFKHFRSIYLNGTPIRDKNGYFNFSRFHFDIRGGYYKNGNANSSYFTRTDIHRDYRDPLLSKEFRIPAYTHTINYPLYGPTNESDKDYYYTHTVKNPEISMVSLSIKVNELHYIYEGDESILYLNLRPTVYAIIAYIIAQKILDTIVNFAIPDPQVDTNTTFGTSFPCGGPVASSGMGVGINPPALSGAAEMAATEITKNLITSVGSLMAFLIGFAIGSKFPCSRGDMGFLCIKMGSIIKNSGEIWPAKIKFKIEYGIEGQPLTTKDLVIQGCATSSFVKDIFLQGFSDLNPKSGNNYRNRIIKIYRTTREMDPVTGGIIEARYKIGAELFSVNEFVAGYFSYPNSATIATRINSKDMPDIPRREYLLKGKLVKVPTAYKPHLGVHENIWNGTFESKIQWTSNPAWIIYDLLINPIYGMGKYGLKEEDIDKWSFWKFSKKCDEPVTVTVEGTTTRERRFMCNIYINSQRPAYDLIKELMNLYSATINFSGGKVYISFESDGSDNDAGGSIMLFNNANVTESGFSYATTPQTSRITACTVDYLDERDNYQMKSEYYEDIEGIKEHGYQAIKIAGIAITRRGEANRLALNKVHSRQLEKEVVNFSTGLQGSYLRIGDIIEIADNYKMSHQCGGRIMKVDSTDRKKIHIDIPVSALPPEIDRIFIQDVRNSVTPDSDDQSEPDRTKQYQSFRIDERSGFVLTLSSAVSDSVRAGFIWLIKSGTDTQENNIGSKEFRVKNIKELKSGSEYEITALEHSRIKYEIIDGGATVELDDAEYNEHEVVATDTFTDVI